MWRIHSCKLPTIVSFLVPPTQPIAPGDVITVNETSSPKCWEVQYSLQTGTGSKTLQNFFEDCGTCDDADYGFQYFGVFCDGQDPPQYFNSDIQLAVGDVLKILDGTYIDRCIEIVLEAPGETTVGNINTSQIYEDCNACDGITDPQVCTTDNISLAAGAEISYEQNGNTFTEALLNGTYQRCGTNFQVISGVASFAPGTRLCTSNFDCAIRFKTSCHTLYGGNAGGSFEYQDTNGNWVLNQFVPQFQQLDVCAVINSVTVIGGCGQYTNNNTRCNSNGDCDGTSTPGDSEGYEISNDGGGVGNYNYTECSTGNTIEGALNPGESIYVCSTTVPNISGGLTVGLSPVQC